MKKIIFTLTFFFATFSIVAQEHLSFKGIPIEGSLTEFCKKLEAKGFKDQGTSSDGKSKIFLGDFAGRNAFVSAYQTTNSNNIYAVVAMFDPSQEWYSLLSTYNYFKELYTEKYGKPIECIEENGANSERNTSMMIALDQGLIEYKTSWRVTGGFISLGISKVSEIYTGSVFIAYLDSNNSNINRLNALDDI